MQKDTTRPVGWKYTVTALALSVAMAPMAQAASVLKTTGRLELKGAETNQETRSARRVVNTLPTEILATKTKEVAGQTYTLQKVRDRRGDVGMVLLNGRGQEISERDLPRDTRSVVHPDVVHAMERRTDGRALYKVRIGLDVACGSGQTLGECFEQRNSRIESWAFEHGLQAHSGVQDALESSASSVTVELNAAQIAAVANSGDPMVAGIELYASGRDNLTEAVIASKVSTHATPFALTRGDGVGIYAPEEGCTYQYYAQDQYKKVGSPFTDHAYVTASILKEVAPDSWIYCQAGGAVLPGQKDLDIGLWETTDPWDYNTDYAIAGMPSIEVVTTSYSTDHSPEYTLEDRDWDNFVYQTKIPAFSGSNDIGGTGHVGSPGKGLNVITVGYYDDVTGVVGTVSPYAGSVVGNDKPEILAPGNNVQIPAPLQSMGDLLGNPLLVTGASAATPHAAAFAADIMSQSKWFTRKPALMKALMLAGATDSISGDGEPFGAIEEINSQGIPTKTGVGGINFKSANYSATKYYWSSDNAGFHDLDAADGAFDKYLTQEVFVDDSYDKARVALAWVNRGDYVYDHQNDLQPLSIDFDLEVYDPNNVLVGESNSMNNGFEVVDFAPTIAGNYTFKIRRAANNDVECDVRLGVVVSKFHDGAIMQSFNIVPTP